MKPVFYIFYQFYYFFDNFTGFSFDDVLDNLMEDTLSNKDDEIDSSESNEQSSGKNGNSESEGNGNLFEDGYDIQTHGGGQIEEVRAFNDTTAMIKGIGKAESVVIDQELWRLPRSCDLEYADEPPESVKW